MKLKNRMFRMLGTDDGNAVVWPISHPDGITILFLVPAGMVEPMLEREGFVDGWKCAGCGGFVGAFGSATFYNDDRPETPIFVGIIQENAH